MEYKDIITEQDLNEYLRKEEADFTGIYVPSAIRKAEGMEGWVYDIQVDWGDWKHHLRLTYLMELIGYKQTRNDVTESDGSDCYSSIHRFVWEKVYKMFND